ncbi:MAG: hypothetical protein H7249_05890 [Chitinophagaceae bacterium]|nr:hypothetical protein [Oligoflexus sp.]
MKKLIVLLSVLSSSALFGFGEKHSSVETKTHVIGQNLEIEVLVKPDAGLHVTKDGPWSVTFTKAPGLNLEMKDGKYVSKSFDEKIPGFKVLAPIDSAAKSGTIAYEVRAFICTDDKKQCYPQQLSGTIAWKKS